jgi:DNA-binding SARP family transcriptional activator
MGPLEVLAGGRLLTLGEPQQQIVLAVLLLDPGRPVGVDRLVDAVWGDRAPATAPKQIRNRVGSLRRLLVEAGADPDVIVTDRATVSRSPHIKYRPSLHARSVPAGPPARVRPGTTPSLRRQA